MMNIEIKDKQLCFNWSWVHLDPGKLGMRKIINYLDMWVNPNDKGLGCESYEEPLLGSLNLYISTHNNIEVSYTTL